MEPLEIGSVDWLRAQVDLNDLEEVCHSIKTDTIKDPNLRYLWSNVKSTFKPFIDNYNTFLDALEEADEI